MNGKESKVKTVVIVATAILVLMSMLPAMVSAQSGVKINEIMYDPSTEQGSDANMEWIELYNNDAEAINISDWTIDGNQIADMVMEPGDYVVLAMNKTAFDAYYGALPCSVIDVTLGLKNDPGDTIVLGDSTGTEIDNVTYNASWGADGNGKTLERTATGGWAESLVDGGTPCAENGMTIVRRGTPIIVEEKRIGTVVITRPTTGDIKINEIMYDLPGSDVDLEWIELYNDVTKAINITDWKFYEADTNHRLVLVQGSMVIPIGGYAIIANNATAFLKEHPMCNCTVIDSTFSLHNTGEYIALKNATLVLVDNVAYNSSCGAGGNGKTLERTATGAWAESTVDGGTPCNRNSVLGTRPKVINASANPPVIAVNTDITELRVDVAGVDSPIDAVTVDLSHIGGNASTIMSNIGNYTADNILWTMYKCTTNASVEGTFNLTVNATDINGNYNDMESILLEVKETIIPLSTVGPPVIYIFNITVDTMIPDNVGKNATMHGLFTSTEVIDNETYYLIEIRKPAGCTKMYVGMDVENKEQLMKRTVTEREQGVEIANLTADPAFVNCDFPLWAGKTWTDATNVTGNMLIPGSDDAIEQVNSSTDVSGAVTREVVTVPIGTYPCLEISNNVSFELNGLPVSISRKYWIHIGRPVLFPKAQHYVNGALTEEFELIDVIPPTVLTAADNNSEINVTKPRFLVIVLKANPTTGYLWEVAGPLDEQVLREVEGMDFVPESDLPGAGGVQVIRFEVVGAGPAVIKLVYHRPWETDVEPLDTFTVNVTAS